MQIFELFGTILLHDNGVEGQIDRIDNRAQKTHKSFGNMIGTAAKWGAALAVAVGGIAVASIKDASEAEASLAQLDAVLKSTGGAAGVTRDELTDLADSLEKTTKFSAESTQAAEGLLLTFTNIGKDVFPEATKTALDMATALGGDAAGQSIALGKALNDPTKGITALTRVGVTFSEEQKNVIKKLQETGDMAGAQKVILAELNKEFGGSAEAAGKTFAGQLVILKNAIGNVTETLGAALIPKLTELLNWVTPNLPAIGNFFSGVFDKIIYIVPIAVGKIKELWEFAEVNLIPKFKEIIKVVGEIAEKYFPSLGNGAGTLQATLGDLVITGLNLVIAALKFVKDNSDLVKFAVGTMGTAFLIYKGYVIGAAIATGVMTFATNAQRIATVISTAAQWLFNAALSANPIGVVVIALAAMGFAIYQLVKHWDSVTGAIRKAWDWLTKWNRTKMQDKGSARTPTNWFATPGNATGTDFWSGGDTWVGEEGPEIIRLPRGSQVIPNDKSMAKSNNGLTLNIGTFINNRKEDIEELMQEAEMYRQMHSKAIGGAY